MVSVHLIKHDQRGIIVAVIEDDLTNPEPMPDDKIIECYIKSQGLNPASCADTFSVSWAPVIPMAKLLKFK